MQKCTPTNGIENVNHRITMNRFFIIGICLDGYVCKIIVIHVLQKQCFDVLRQLLVQKNPLNYRNQKVKTVIRKLSTKIFFANNLRKYGTFSEYFFNVFVFREVRKNIYFLFCKCIYDTSLLFYFSG